MPLLTELAGIGLTNYGFSRGESAAHWIGYLGNTGYTHLFDAKSDSASNNYFAGWNTVSGYNKLEIVKLNKTGVNQWQRQLGSASGNMTTAYKVSVASSGNVYAISTYAWTYGVIAKYDSSGTLQWQKSIYNGGNNSALYSLTLDSSENVIVGGSADVSGIMQPVLMKLNSSGVIQWQRKLTGTYGGSINDIITDSSGNVYGVYDGTSATTQQLAIVKYNSSGTYQWTKGLSFTNLVTRSIGVDSSSNVYAVANSSSLGNNDMFLEKYDSSGTLQWQRRLGGASQFIPFGVKTDSTGNVFVGGYTGAPGPNSVQVAKYNSSGTLQWQRRISASDEMGGQTLGIDATGDVLLAGYIYNASFRYGFMAKIPSDGSKTGTYTVGSYSMTYTASSLTDSTPTQTSVTPSYTDGAISLTVNTSTLTDASGSLTVTTKAI